jgi:hypothetical protein
MAAKVALTVASFSSLIGMPIVEVMIAVCEESSCGNGMASRSDRCALWCINWWLL